MIIRKATIEDVEFILPELKRFAESLLVKHSLWSGEDYPRKLVASMINDHLFLLAEDDKGLLGFVSGLLVPHFFNPDLKNLIEVFWWVVPERRGSAAAARLLDAFVKAGRDEGAKVICFTYTSQTRAGHKHLEKRGFKFRESNFILET